MKTARLKNIVIIILVLVNAFLLFLLLSQRMTAQNDYERTAAQLVTLYESNGISLSADILPKSTSLPTAQPQREIAQEEAFARELFDAAVSVDSGGGIYRYYTDDGVGSCLFRGNGSVEATLSRAVDEPTAFCRELCRAYGYTELTESFDGLGGTVTATRSFGGAAVYNCMLMFTFEGSTLVSVSGSFLPQLPEGSETFTPDPVTALVRFLDYRNASGVVCTKITDVSCGYLLRSDATGAQRLLPAVRLSSDVYSYYVDAESGEVIRAG